MNDFEKHLQKNRHGVKGELKIELSDGRVIITFVKNLVEDSDTIPIGLDAPIAVGNDPGKEDFIDFLRRKIFENKKFFFHQKRSKTFLRSNTVNDDNEKIFRRKRRAQFSNSNVEDSLRIITGSVFISNYSDLYEKNYMKKENKKFPNIRKVDL